MLRLTIGMALVRSGEFLRIVAIHVNPDFEVQVHTGERIGADDLLSATILEGKLVRVDSLEAGSRIHHEGSLRTVVDISGNGSIVALTLDNSHVLLGESSNEVESFLELQTHEVQVSPEVPEANGDLGSLRVGASDAETQGFLLPAQFDVTSGLSGSQVVDTSDSPNASYELETYSPGISVEVGDDYTVAPVQSLGSTVRETMFGWLVIGVVGLCIIVAAYGAWDFVNKHVLHHNSSGISDEMLAEWNVELQQQRELERFKLELELEKAKSYRAPVLSAPSRTSITCSTTGDSVMQTTHCF